VSDFRFARKGAGCGVCKKDFAPGDEFISAIFLAEDGDLDDEVQTFQRLDACPACFEKLEVDAYSRWLTRRPEEGAPKPLLDLGMARDFLVRLCREADPEREGLAYILALLLLRKRRVKLVTQRVEEGVTVMDLTVKTGEGDEVEEITMPVRELTEEETAGIEAELGRLFGLGPTSEEEDAEGGAP
jgi:hypothetical protein